MIFPLAPFSWTCCICGNPDNFWYDSSCNAPCCYAERDFCCKRCGTGGQAGADMRARPHEGAQLEKVPEVVRSYNRAHGFRPNSNRGGG